MEKFEKLYIVMPAYNEEENIKDVVKQWYPILKFGNDDSRLLVSDFGSTDRTHGILEELKKEYPKLEIVNNFHKQHGPKLMCLYDYAIKNNADWVFQTDSDGQTSPEEFEGFWKNREKYDVILGNRTVRGDGKIRDLVEKVVCFLLKLYFGVKVPDANAPFRLMKNSTLKNYLYRLPEDYNLPNIMLTTYFVYYNENVSFQEISFNSRKAGKNSINIRKIIKIGSKALSDFRKFKIGMKKADD